MLDGLLYDAGMTQDGNDTIDNAEEFENDIHSLESNVQELLSIWSGEAANAFRLSFEDKTAELMRFKKTLITRGENIVKASNELQRNEEDLAAAGSHLF